MMVYTALVIVFFGTTITASSETIPACGADDTACVDRLANNVYQRLMVGIPALGIEPHEPTHHAVIEGNLSVLKYKFLNATFVGLDKCTLSNAHLDQVALKVHVEMSCPRIEMRADYEISGRLIILPVEGAGECHVLTGKYNMAADCDVKISEGSDGEKHVTIKSYQLQPEAAGPIVFNFKNLFNGQKDLSDAVHKFANENWKEVADFVQGPVWSAHAGKLISAANKFLKNVSLDKMTIK